MYKRYYDGYHSCLPANRTRGEIITPKCTDDTYRQNEECDKICCYEEKNVPCPPDEKKPGKCSLSFPGELDDIILIGILLLLLTDSESTDPIMLIIIGIILLGDKL